MNYHRGQYLESSLHDVFFVRDVYPRRNLVKLWSYSAGQEILSRISAIKTAGYVVTTTRDGVSLRSPRRIPPKLKCKLGHAMTKENTYKDPRGSLSCRICNAARGNRRRLSKRAAKATHGPDSEGPEQGGCDEAQPDVNAVS